jgi:hypothetical protein
MAHDLHIPVLQRVLPDVDDFQIGICRQTVEASLKPTCLVASVLKNGNDGRMPFKLFIFSKIALSKGLLAS